MIREEVVKVLDGCPALNKKDLGPCAEYSCEYSNIIVWEKGVITAEVFGEAKHTFSAHIDDVNKIEYSEADGTINIKCDNENTAGMNVCITVKKEKKKKMPEHYWEEPIEGGIRFHKAIGSDLKSYIEELAYHRLVERGEFDLEGETTFNLNTIGVSILFAGVGFKALALGDSVAAGLNDKVKDTVLDTVKGRMTITLNEGIEIVLPWDDLLEALG